jgi:hypothetical protein
MVSKKDYDIELFNVAHDLYCEARDAYERGMGGRTAIQEERAARKFHAARTINSELILFTYHEGKPPPRWDKEDMQKHFWNMNAHARAIGVPCIPVGVNHRQSRNDRVPPQDRPQARKSMAGGTYALYFPNPYNSDDLIYTANLLHLIHASVTTARNTIIDRGIDSASVPQADLEIEADRLMQVAVEVNQAVRAMQTRLPIDRHRIEPPASPPEPPAIVAAPPGEDD